MILFIDGNVITNRKEGYAGLKEGDIEYDPNNSVWWILVREKDGECLVWTKYKPTKEQLAKLLLVLP